MSNSAYAYLFYGFVLRDNENEDGEKFVWEENDESDDDWYDWSGYLMHKAGIKYEDNKELYFAEKHKLENVSQCDINYCGYGGYGDATRPFVYVKDSFTQCYASEEKTCNVVKSVFWDLWLKDFCDKLGIEFKQPNWTLAAYYG